MIMNIVKKIFKYVKKKNDSDKFYEQFLPDELHGKYIGLSLKGYTAHSIQYKQEPVMSYVEFLGHKNK